jgi:hypothetical protein
MQVDGTWMNELGVTIAGEAFPHMLIHAVLPYSTHELGREKDGDRVFNDDYRSYVEALGMEPRSTHVASPDENGDVEAAHRTLKRCVEQHLLLRGSRDFLSLEEYEAFLLDVIRRLNSLVRDRFEDELKAMAPLQGPVPAPVREVRARVGKAGTARVLNRPYSLPSGLQGELVTARVTEWRIEFWYAGRCVRDAARRPGATHPCIDYRHVIPSLLRKPGGFRNYRYRDALFPSQVFKRAWEALQGWLSPRRADLAYLRVLQLAATTLEDDVAAALDLLLQTGEPFDDQTVSALVKPPRAPVPLVDCGPIDLRVYDALLVGIP